MIGRAQSEDRLSVVRGDYLLLEEAFRPISLFSLSCGCHIVYITELRYHSLSCWFGYWFGVISSFVVCR